LVSTFLQAAVAVLAIDLLQLAPYCGVLMCYCTQPQLSHFVHTLLLLPFAAIGHSRGASNATLYGCQHGDIPMMVLVGGRFDLTFNMMRRCVQLHFCYNMAYYDVLYLICQPHG
jgi:hypothetical protein